MSQEDYGQFSCEFCGKSFPWKSPLAGKKIRCTCGEAIVVPTTAPGAVPQPQAPADEDGMYDLADDPTPVKKPARVPPTATAKAGAASDDNYDLAPDPVSAAKPARTARAAKAAAPAESDDLDLKPAAAPKAKPRPSAKAGPTSPMLAYQQTSRSHDDAPKAKSDFANRIGGEPWRELYLPAGLVVLGVALNIFLFLRLSGGKVSIGQIMLPLALTLLLNLILSFAGVLMVSRWLDISFGHPGPATLKLSAVILIPSALAGLAALAMGSADPWTLMGVRLIIVMPLTAVGLVVLFQIGLDDALYCITVIYLVTQWATIFLVNAIAGDPDRTGAAAAVVLNATMMPGGDGAEPRSRTPWVQAEIARNATPDALDYLTKGDRTIGALPPVQAIQLVQSFKDAGATQTLLHMPRTYRGYTLFIGLPEDETKRNALIGLYKQTHQQLELMPGEVYPEDRYLIIEFDGGGYDASEPVMPDGSADTRPLDQRKKPPRPAPKLPPKLP